MQQLLTQHQSLYYAWQLARRAASRNRSGGRSLGQRGSSSSMEQASSPRFCEQSGLSICEKPFDGGLGAAKPARRSHSASQHQRSGRPAGAVPSQGHDAFVRGHFQRRRCYMKRIKTALAITRFAFGRVRSMTLLLSVEKAIARISRAATATSKLFSMTSF